MPDNQTTYVQGTQAMSLPVFPLDGGQALGTIRLVNLGAAMRCLQDVDYGSLVPSTGKDASLWSMEHRQATRLAGLWFWTADGVAWLPAI